MPTEELRFPIAVADLRKLARRYIRRDLGLFMIEGKKVMSEALESGIVIKQVIATDKFVQQNRQFFTTLHIPVRDVTTISDHHAQQLSDVSTPPGIFAVAQLPRVTLDSLTAAKLIMVLDDIRDPGNLGAMLRCADWFGVEGVVISASSVDPYQDKVLRAAMGSVFHLPIIISDDLEGDVKALQEQGFAVVVTRPEVESTVNFKEVTKLCLVLGNESRGTSPEIDQLATATWSLPRLGKAESLNVAVTTGIALYELRKQWQQ